MNDAWNAPARPRTPRAPSRPARWSQLLAALAVTLTGCAGERSAPSASPGMAAAADFYVTQGALPAQPGVLLRSEPLPAALGLAAAGRQLRILYTSTDGAGGPGMLPTSGAVFYPPGAAPSGGWPVIAWAHGTVGIGDGCAPSRNPRTARDSAYLNAWLREGYAVVATDYQGLGTAGPHLYLNARAQAYAILDSVRAALGGLPDLANRVVLLGQSQGGGAVFATAGFAPAYAPELDVRGSVASGTPHLARQNAPTFAPDRVNPTLAYVMYATRTAQVFDPALKDREVFTDRALPVLAQSDTLCVGPLETAVVNAGLTNANALVPTGPALLFARLGKSVAYPTLKLSQPLFMATGEKDVDVSAEQQIALAKDACKAGSRVEQHVYPGLDHSATVNASLVDSVPFVRRVLAGQDIASTCATGP
jgi:dienelactone hydrolase